VTSDPASIVDSALTRLAGAGKAGRIAAPTVDLMRSGGVAAVIALRDAARTSQWATDVRGHVYRRIWTDAAERLGARVAPFGDQFLAITRGSSRTIVSYQQVQLDTAIDLLVALHRRVVQERLMARSIPVAAYREFSYDDIARGREFLDRFAPCVVKPASGTSGGEGVTCRIETTSQLIG
jgi:hypothetical protein